MPGVDDGASDMSVSVKMMNMASVEGTVCIALTPHFLQGFYEVPIKSMIEKLNILNELAEEKSINIKFCCGNEVYITDDLPKLLEEKKVLTINGSRYLLIEFPLLDMPFYTDNIIFKLMTKGYVPIIAHPERNVMLSSDIKLVKKLVEQGVLMQINGGSITGKYGKSACRSANNIVKSGLAHFIASDAHSDSYKRPGLNKARENIEKNFGEETADKLFYRNPLAVINNEII